MFIKVEGTDYVKDTQSGAILMTGRTALVENEARKKLAHKINGKNDEINKLKDQVTNLTSEISEIKGLLVQLLQQSKE